VLDRIPLGIRLALAFVLVVLIAVVAVAAMVNQAVERHFGEYVSVGMARRLETLAPSLQQHYARVGSWEGVEATMSGTQQGQGQGQGAGAGRGMGASSNPILLTDADGRIVYDSSGESSGTAPRSLLERQGLAVEVGGETVGYLLVGNGPREVLFRSQINASILWSGALVALVAILLGIYSTRALTKPLRALRDAARRIGAGDLSYRVPLRSHDEIGDLAQQFNEMGEALARDEHVRQRMMADIAHELRTPVTVMRGQLEALLDGVFDLDEENLVPIHDQTLLLARLINDLRDLALADAGRLSLERDEMDLGRLVERVAASFRSRAHAQGVSLMTEVADNPLAIWGDAQRLEQVLGNLITNALRHTPLGGSVRLEARGDRDDIVVEVIDTGGGIAPADLAHVFDRFYRADEARSRRDGGSGLGLAIVEQLVEAHEGAISVASEVDVGTTFTIRLPRRHD